MFAKPFRVKSNTQMKGSDKKKLKSEIRKRFPSAFDLQESGSDPIDDIISPKEDISVSKVFTFSGESYLVYYQAKNPIFFEPEKEKGHLYPTVYTLWTCPSLLPALTTHPLVVEKLANGADLMLPGVVINHKLGIKAYLNGKIKRGDVLAVNLTNNKAPIAIGTAAHSSEDMYMTGHRGKGVVILHCLGDQLWASGSKGQAPDLGPPDGLNFNEEESSDENEPSEEGSNNVTGDAEDDPVDDVTDATVDGLTDALANEVLDDGDEEEDDDATALENPETAEASESTAINEPEPEDDNMDELLENAFLQACKTSMKKVELPILSSNFFRGHMVTSCPPGKTLDVKKSSYKKLSKFLSQMKSDGIISVTEPKKGVEMISSINYEHPKLESFRVIKYERSETNSQTKASDQGFEPPVVTELRIVSGDVSKFFKACGIAKGQGLTLTQVRDTVKAYIDRHDLQNKADPKLVSLSDPILSEAVLVKGEEIKVTTLPWEKVYSRVMSKMSQGYSLTYRGCPATVQRGKLELIELSVATRSGNKKVTLVHNLDVFGIDLAEFGHKCQVGVAASTSIHEAANKKRAGGLPVQEVLIQGNQVAFVGKLLTETYKIPKKYIKGLELAIKSKKGK